MPSWTGNIPWEGVKKAGGGGSAGPATRKVTDTLAAQV